MALTGREGPAPCGSERRTCRECGENQHSCSCGHDDGGCSCGENGCSCEHETDDGDVCKCHQADVRHVAIAIDGPAGAGKTSTAKAVAKALGYVYVDTGALYRAFAVHKLWLAEEMAAKEPDKLPVTNDMALHTFDLEFVYQDGEQVMLLWGENINPYIRTEQVSMESSNVSADPAVRSALLEFQRRQARAYDVVMEGRDIGTVVLPEAQVKVFLTASLTARANRRCKDLIAHGESADYCAVMEQLRTRDWQDTTRKVAPLKEACDSVKIDNTDMTLEEAVAKVLEIVGKKLG